MLMHGRRRIVATTTIIGFGAILGTALNMTNSENGRLQIALVIGVSVASVGLLLALRSTALGKDLPFLAYISACLCGAGVLLITFSGVRLSAHVTAADALLLAGGGILVFSALTERFKGLVIPRWLGFSAGMLVLAVSLSAVRSVNPVASFTQGFELLLALTATTSLMAAISMNLRRAVALASLWLASASINGLAGLLDFFHLTAIGLTLNGQEFLGRMAGLSAHPNHLGIFCAMALPISLYLMSTAVRLRSRILCGGLAALVVLGILFSGSRAALIAAAVGAVLTVILQTYRRSRVIVVLAAVAVASGVASTLLLSASNPEFITQRLAGGALVSLSDAGRLDYYQQAWSAFIASPLFGNGFDLVRQAHDLYLQLLQAGGVLALTGFGVFAVASVAQGLRLARCATLSARERALASALTSASIVWLVAGLTQNYIYDRALYVPAGLLLGMQLTVRRLERSGSDTSLSNATRVNPGQEHSSAPGRFPGMATSGKEARGAD